MANLKVRAIQKFHNDKGILVGYTIQDIVTGQTRNVYKDELKNAVAKGLCEVVNMTLTSDGRLIGKAAPAPNPKKKAVAQSNKSGVKLFEVYTNGKNISAALIDIREYNAINNIKEEQIVDGVTPGFSFDVGHEVLEKIQHGWYDNIKVQSDKFKFEDFGIKKKTFKSIKAKLSKVLETNWGKPEFTVTKGNNKYEYIIAVANWDNRIENSDTLSQLLYALITDAMYIDKIKVVLYNDNEITVSCMTGIKDVRNALKNI